MQKFKLLFLLVITLFMTSCGNNNSADPGIEADAAKETKANTKSSIISVGSDTKIAYDEIAIQLDNGKKWKANSETTEGVKSMMVSVKKAMTAGVADISGYRTLGASLQKDFNYIFEKCNMTGESHEQLHNFLLPMVDMVKAFEQSDMNACEQTLPLIKEHLGGYYSYFE